MKLLKIFYNVLTLNGHYTFKKNDLEPVPDSILQLWKSRGYEPASKGVARVRYEMTPNKEYIYPAFFWSE